MTNEMEQASGKVAVLALTDRASDRNDANWIEKWLKRVGVEPTGDRKPAARRF